MSMSQSHKDALAEGRRQARAIKRYLAAMGRRRPGRPVTVESVQERISRIDAKLEAIDDPLARVDLLQARLDAEETLRDVESAPDIEGLEEGFVSHVKAYSERKGISYAAWREVGVPAAVLKRGGIARNV